MKTGELSHWQTRLHSNGPRQISAKKETATGYRAHLHSSRRKCTRSPTFLVRERGQASDRNFCRAITQRKLRSLPGIWCSVAWTAITSRRGITFGICQRLGRTGSPIASEIASDEYRWKLITWKLSLRMWIFVVVRLLVSRWDTELRNWETPDFQCPWSYWNERQFWKLETRFNNLAILSR